MEPENDFTFTTRINEEPAAASPSASKPLASATGPTFSVPAKLEPFLLLAKSARGAGAAKLIQEATAAPGVFTFAELLDMPNLKELRNNPEWTSHYNLLQLFAYGSYKDYKAQAGALPALKAASVTKLKQLTLVTLAARTRILPYCESVRPAFQISSTSTALLTEELEISSIRELEDLIIEAIYAGLLTGRLDQLKSRFHIDSVAGRDVQHVDPLTSALQSWVSVIEQQITAIDNRIGEIKSADDRKAQGKAATSQRIRTVLAELNAEPKGAPIDSSFQTTTLSSPRKAARGALGRGDNSLASLMENRKGVAATLSKNDMDLDDPPEGSSGGRASRTGRKRNRPV